MGGSKESVKVLRDPMKHGHASDCAWLVAAKTGGNHTPCTCARKPLRKPKT